jgi:hypothetical protein
LAAGALPPAGAAAAGAKPYFYLLSEIQFINE